MSNPPNARKVYLVINVQPGPVNRIKAVKNFLPNKHWQNNHGVALKAAPSPVHSPNKLSLSNAAIRADSNISISI